jgi:hypothetical protein
MYNNKNNGVNKFENIDKNNDCWWTS